MMQGSTSLRDHVATLMKDAMKAGDKTRVGALRLIMAALKDREIEARDAGREELAAQEAAEIAVINEFLPKQMDDDAVMQAARKAIAETGASSMRDMGKVVAALKEAYPGQMDFAKA